MLTPQKELEARILAECFIAYEVAKQRGDARAMLHAITIIEQVFKIEAVMASELITSEN
jgi:hypothetical protein